MKNEKEFFENIKTYKLIANKSLGQNFLVNNEIAKNIVSLLDINNSEKVLEIGAGLGSLSFFLASSDSKIDLIDVDERMLLHLDKEFKEKENMHIFRHNILKLDISNYDKIIGNLPYYITSEIIEYLLLNARNVKKIVLMCQKEVYPKLLQSFKSPLSLLLNYVADISKPINVGRNSFIPVPHVDSVVFVLTPNKNIKSENKELFSIIKNIFLYKRKNILNCLSSITKDKDKALNILNKLNVDINKRPEQLDINFYISLKKELPN